jgi:hypothetical protein
MNERWGWNGPEEGDTMDLSVIIMFDGEEVIEISDSGDSTVLQRKALARLICDKLNDAEAIAL